MFKDFKVVKDRPVYIKLKDYLKKMSMTGHLLGNQKIPSTRELSELLSVSRNTVLAAYADLE
ncbi:GntR family transcriptional regulator, partial [Bacillus thuringiensis]|uniref:GntR family transcriptional regulator n=1 Tax=Bacillus thuringiensis TaxID=1428 RepID=UPI002DBEB035